MSFIILDRDGVINYDSDEYIKSPEEWVPIPGSLEAIAALNRAGFQILIATNQSGIGRRLYDLKTLDLIHEKMIQALASVGGYIDEIFFCPHLPEENCPCRKPKAGLIKQIESKYPIHLSNTFFIGDSLSDVKAAENAGCLPLLVLTGKGEQSIALYPALKRVPCFENLARAVDYVLREQRINDTKKILY